MSSRVISNPAADRTLAGIGLGVLAYFLFSGHDATVKVLVSQLPAWQILFVRSTTILVACLLIGRGPLIERAVTTPLKKALLLRSVLTLTGWLCYYGAAKYLPLAQLMTLYFSAPLMITAMAGPVLGEHASRGQWVAVGIGFIGVMLASDPLGVRLSIPAVMVLIAAAAWGYGVVLMRQIAKRESSLLQIAWGNVVFAIATAIVSMPDWHETNATQWVLLFGVAAIGGFAQFCMFEGARRAPASVMATVEYTGLIWAFVLGYLIFGDIPRPAVFAGAALIVVAGVLLVGIERRRLRRGAVPAQMG